MLTFYDRRVIVFIAITITVCSITDIEQQGNSLLNVHYSSQLLFILLPTSLPKGVTLNRLDDLAIATPPLFMYTKLSSDCVNIAVLYKIGQFESSLEPHRPSIMVTFPTR